ncbi:hypothetical protein Hdeb2414_s0027g00695191 [Helianthus debilis subsp. tardiflorus]
MMQVVLGFIFGRQGEVYYSTFVNGFQHTPQVNWHSFKRIAWHSFKRIAKIDNNNDKDADEEALHNDDWSYDEDSDFELSDDMEYEEDATPGSTRLMKWLQ